MTNPMTRDQAEEVKNSQAWKYLQAEITYRIDCTLQSLKTCKPEFLTETQKRIQGLEEILQIPDSVIDREENQIKRT